MPDREKVIAILDCMLYHHEEKCKGRYCPHYKECNGSSVFKMIMPYEVCKDALDFLKEQEPRVLDWNEIGTVDGAVWLEDRDKSEVVPGLVMQMHSAVNLDIKKDGKLRTASASRSDYGDRWRAWSARPTEEQMRDTKWEGDSDE